MSDDHTTAVFGGVIICNVTFIVRSGLCLVASNTTIKQQAGVIIIIMK